MTVSAELAGVLHKLIDHVPWREEADKTEAHQVLNDETAAVTALASEDAEGTNE
jgi:hypothetical protein